jgi:hypothetical protein
VSSFLFSNSVHPRLFSDYLALYERKLYILGSVCIHLERMNKIKNLMKEEILSLSRVTLLLCSQWLFRVGPILVLLSKAVLITMVM